MSFSKEDCKRALFLLKKLNDSLGNSSEKSLKNSLNHLIAALESDLFDSLIDINVYYRQMLGAHVSVEASEGREPPVAPNFVDSSNEFPSSNPPDRTSSLGEPSDWEFIEVLISRPPGHNQSFGFSIAGGYDAPQENGDPSVFITRIASGGIAEAGGLLRPFDRIVSVNGTDLTYVSNQEAVRILKESGDTLAMIIRRYIGPEPVSSGIGADSPIPNVNMPITNEESTAREEMYFEANLVKPSENVSLGFTIAGGQMADGFSEGIYVTKLTPGGLAERDGQIQPGDRLIQVNGQELNNVTHDTAVQLLRNAGTHVHLVFLRTRESTVSPDFPPSLASDDTIVPIRQR